ncbi:MAG: 30S ribosome-binding factor RbfA [Ruminiclostridium sp.]|nr:30S ribosome-binding factor RbfA [Ruminiclostridium sp.]
MANHNLGRLTEDVKREISAALPEIKDPRVSGEIVSVSRVEITSDLSYCKIYVSVLGDEEKTDSAVKALERSAGFIVRRINARIKMRKMPRLIFLPDNSQEYYERITGIIDKLGIPGGEDSKDAEDGADTADSE